MNLIDILQKEEGFSMTPYLCSAGYVTIGLGTKLHKQLGQDPSDFPITVTRQIAEVWLNTEVKIKSEGLMNGEHSHTFRKLDADRRAIVLSMAYQMGVGGTHRFYGMWRELEAGNWDAAAMEALDSNWAKQTPTRAVRHSRVLAGERLEDVYAQVQG